MTALALLGSTVAQARELGVLLSGPAERAATRAGRALDSNDMKRVVDRLVAEVERADAKADHGRAQGLLTALKILNGEAE